MSQFELISFDLCPFVQRSVITLNVKNVDFELKYIDLNNKPDWFLKISPLGKVPVLHTQNTSLFESAVINEYLDEVTQGTSLPTDPLEKAKSRAWIEFGSTAIMSMYMMTVAKDLKGYEAHKGDLLSKLLILEANVSGGDFFDGEQFSLVDAALAPLFTRLLICERTFGEDYLSTTPKIQQWATAISSKDYVIKSEVEDFEKIFVNYLIDHQSFITKK